MPGGSRLTAKPAFADTRKIDRPTTASDAPTQPVEVQPRPESIASPPSQAPERVGDVERGVVERRREGLGVLGHVHQADLQRRDQRHPVADEQHVQQRQPSRRAR